MLILHGEHSLASRAVLLDVVAEAKSQNSIVKWLDGKKLTPSQLELTLAGESLFAEPQLIVVEQPFAGPKSKRKDEVLAILAQTQLPITTQIVLWETKTLTASQLKPFPQAKVQVFKLANALFAWLESFSPLPTTKPRQIGLLHAAVTAESAELCLIMLQRHLKVLLQIKDGEPPAMAPFAVAKRTQQAQAFTLPQLISTHRQLFEIEKRQKTGTSQSNLCQELELLILKL